MVTIERPHVSDPEEPLRVALLGPVSNPVYHATRAVLAVTSRVEIVLETDERVIPRILTESKTDVLIAAGYHHFIGPKTRTAARIASVGLHPALLPAYRGSYPLWWALRNGETEAGLTLYLLDDGIDTGAVISQARVAISRRETFATLYRKVAHRVPDLIRPFVLALIQGDPIHAVQQDDAASSVYRTPSRAMRAWMKARWTLRSLGSG